jgi:competence ComEA-like helix-hairpin-helix protein
MSNLRCRRRIPFLFPLGLALLVLFGGSILPREARAWSFHTHRKLVSDALTRMPAAFAKRFMPFKESFLQGATDPDSLLKDFQNHVFHVHTGFGDAMARFRELFQGIAGSLQRGDPDAQIAYQLGLFAHYIADLNQPLHTAGADSDWNESAYHGKFEKEVEGQLSKIPLQRASYHPVTDPAARLKEMAVAANQHYAAIGEAYRRGNRIFDLQNIVETQYNAALTQILDYWLGIFQAAGMGFDLDAPGQIQMSQEIAPASDLPTSLSSPRGKVDINTASLEQLKAISGIGEKKAQAILAGRPYRSIYDLSKIKGFGVKFVDRISDQITIGP